MHHPLRLLFAGLLAAGAGAETPVVMLLNGFQEAVGRLGE